jgi:peptidoglycan/xylan/chitin deacetylase (PgdA/CDA1 family)
MEKLGIESKYEGDQREKPGISREEKFYRFIFASSVLLAATRSDYTSNKAQASGIDEKAPQGEVYLPSEEELEEEPDGSLTVEDSSQDFIFYPDFLTSPEEFCFLPSNIGSGLDSEGFVVEEEVETVEEAEEEVVEEDVFAKLEERLSPEVKEILSLQPELSFDEDGGLHYEDQDGSNPVLTVETDRRMSFPYEQLNDVKFFVIHYDGGPQKLASGEYRTVLNTINGLNGGGNPSVQFCVDQYPVNNEFVDKDGVGIILSQATGPVPYKGRHVMIGYDLETGREDLNRVKTADLYEQVGVGQDYIDFIRAGYKDFESFSLGLEQVGTNYSHNFPEEFPPNQQIANVLALVEAAAERYGLSAWDVVGHGEIQEKGDPGDEYMLTLRFLLGLSYLLDEQLPDDFLETDDPYDYFVALRDYSVARMGESRYSDWNEIYGLDGVIEWFENEEAVATEESFVDRVLTAEEKEYIANNEIYHLNREEPIIAMTYDDGGREEYIQHIMEVYEKYGLRTTFFVTGEWVERNKELTKEMIDRGFEIGCHGWDHAEMPSLSKGEATKQIEDFVDLMREIDAGYEVKLIRFPFGSRTQVLREIAAEYGLQSVMWSNESGGMDEGTYDNVMRGLEAGDIVLSHSTRWYDVYEAERILQGLLEQGYEVVTVGEVMK